MPVESASRALTLSWRNASTLPQPRPPCPWPAGASASHLQEHLAAALALHRLPPLAATQPAVAQLRALPTWQRIAALGTSPGAGAAGAVAGPKGQARGQQKQQHGVQGAGVGPSWVLLPLLSLLLPDAGEEALQLLAAAAAQL